MVSSLNKNQIIFRLAHLTDIFQQLNKVNLKLQEKEGQSLISLTPRAGLKGKGARGNFYWRAPMAYFMTSSFVKFMFPLIRNVLVCFFQ